MSAKGGCIAHFVNGSVVRVCHQGLFLSNYNGQSDVQTVRYWSRKTRHSKVNVANRKYGQRHRVGRSREGQEARDADCGTGYVEVGLELGYQLESEFIIFGSRDGKEGSDHQSAEWRLVWRPCDGRVGIFEGGECGEEDLPLCFLKVQIGDG